jgi:L-seryl-tRNA(Ser) seleniumtransferase
MNAPRQLPAVGAVLERAPLVALAAAWPRTLVTEAVRSVIAEARAGGPLPDSDAAWHRAVEAHLLARTTSSLRAAINATGVVLHTNLGRAPLAAAALGAIERIASGASTLEYAVDSGTRGSRHVHCAALLAELTGSEDALVVNNCAAALVLALQAFAAGRETLVSRGELVEIGGSFRVPDIMAASGTTLVEVGTTNRTHVTDYRAALSPRTGAIVKVHRSNFTLEGFVAEASVADLVPVAAEGHVPLLHDFGSGLMLNLDAYGLGGEPTARDAVRAGATLVMMSGDKLLGGPQAGILLGTRDAVATLRRHPLARAVRVDKLTLAALEATLQLYREPERALREIPALAMLTAPVATVTARATALARGLDPAFGVRVEASEATVGGGAFPSARIPSAAVTVSRDVEAVEARLRRAALPVIGTVRDGRLRLDLRSVPEAQDAALGHRLREALQS